MPFAVYESLEPVQDGGTDGDAQFELLSVSPTFEHAEQVDRARFIQRRRAEANRHKRLIAPARHYEDFPQRPYPTKEQVLQIVRDNNHMYPKHNHV